MELLDCNSPYWKAKFIDRLPNLFAERIRKQLRENNPTILYENLTYERLIGTCIPEGLSLCNEIKLNHQIKSQRLNEKRQLGEFCEQFGMDMNLKNFSKKSKTRKYSEDRKNKRIKKKSFRKQKSEENSKNNKKFKNQKNDRCYKCGRTSHYANKCKMKNKEKIKKKINKLDLDDNTKQKFISLMEDTDTDSSENYLQNYYDEDITSCEDECNCIIKTELESDNNKFEDEIYLIESQFQNNLQINMISSDIAKLLKEVSDDKIRNQIIEKLQTTDKGKQVVNEEPYSMKKLDQMLKERRNGNIKPTFDLITVEDLNKEITNLKLEIESLKKHSIIQDNRITKLEKRPITESYADIMKKDENLSNEFFFLQSIENVIFRKWYVKINLLIGYNYKKEYTALVDSGADMNCIREEIILTKYFQKTSNKLKGVSGENLDITYKLTNAKICTDGICLPVHFTIVKNISNEMILGNPFLEMILPFLTDKEKITGLYEGQIISFPFISPPQTIWVDEIKNQLIAKLNQINCIKEEINIHTIEDTLKNPKLQNKIKLLQNQFSNNICNNHPNAFWDRKKHMVNLPYEETFNEKDIPTKARPCQMNSNYLEICKKEIQSLLDKRLIRHSKSPWSCTAFYVNKNVEKERGVPRLVINYKPLNKVLKWIRYPISNKKDLLDRLHDAIIFSKFDLKSRYWQIQITENDRYKTAFNVPFGQYEWNVMPFGLKMHPLNFKI